MHLMANFFVDFSQKIHPHNVAATCCLAVKNLPASVTDAHLKELFQVYGEITVRCFLLVISPLYDLLV